MAFPVLDKEQIHRDNLIWMLVAQAVSILPLLFYLPVWLIVFWMAAIVWRLQIHRMKWPFPNFLIKAILCALCIAAIYVSFRGVHSVEPMISFLLCSFVLKTVELHSKKDALIMLYIAFITIACQFLFAQDLLAGLYGMFSLFVLLSAWQAAYFSQGIGIKTCLRRGLTLVLFSIPFMVVLFVVLPRLGPLWQVPLPQKQAKTGFGESLKMGDIGNLVRSSSPAFRVKFDGDVPPPNQMYWRGLVLSHFDGNEWHPWETDSWQKFSGENSVGQSNEFYSYSIVMEPHGYPWLFSLNTPLEFNSSQLFLQINQEHIIQAKKPVLQKAEYSIQSNTAADLKASLTGQLLTREQRTFLTALPASGNEQARQLALRWRRDFSQPRDIVNQALQLFSREFSYTLQPPLLSGDVVDQFIFDTRRGFCEHFSSSFVFLMRSASIPARIIVGYQGGAHNQVEDYYLVKQSDAHAWAEVWLDGKWERVDPTNSVAPSRVELGIEQALSSEDLSEMERSVWQHAALVAVYQQWDALGFAWNRWVLNYDDQRQRGLFERFFGGTSIWKVGFAFLGLCVFIFLSYIGLQWLQKIKPKQTEENRLIQPVLKRLAKRGYPRYAGESIESYVQRLERESPELAKPMKTVAKAYTKVVYAGDERGLSLLKKALKTI